MTGTFSRTVVTSLFADTGLEVSQFLSLDQRNRRYQKLLLFNYMETDYVLPSKRERGNLFNPFRRQLSGNYARNTHSRDPSFCSCIDAFDPLRGEDSLGSGSVSWFGSGVGTRPATDLDRGPMHNVSTTEGRLSGLLGSELGNR